PDFSRTFVLFVAHLFHPVNGFAVERFLNRDVRHGRQGRCAVPMLFSGRKPDHIARVNFFNRSALALRPATAGCDDQSLSEWMRVPRRSSARFKRDNRAADPRWFASLER